MKLSKIIKFFAVRAFEVLVAVLLITFMPNVPPDAKYSESYRVTPVLPFEGKLAINDRLNGAEIWHKGDFHGPEAFAEYGNELYTTLHGGDIVKLSGDHVIPVVKFGKPCKGLYQEHICGRPLGLEFDKNGALYAADAYYGLFKVDVKTGKKLQLVSMDHEIDGKKPKLPNSVAIASNGDIYWTDSSTEFGLRDGTFDALADGSGRLIHYNAKTKKNEVLIRNIHFANGVALSSDESFVIVAETARSRIRRYYLKGPKQGTSDIFVDGLPGLPDNIQSFGKNGFVVPLIVQRDSEHPISFQILGPFPLARKFVSRVLGLIELGFKVADQIYPSEWLERGIHFIGHFESFSFLLPRNIVSIVQISEQGDIVDSFHATDKRISSISEFFIYKDHVYLGSPFNHYIGRVPLEKAGLMHLKKRDIPATARTTATPSTTTRPPTTTTQPPTTTTQPPTTTRPPTTTQQPTTSRPPTTTQPPTTTTTTRPPTTTQQKTKPTTTRPPTTTQPPTTTKPSTATQAPPKPTTTQSPTTRTPTTGTSKESAQEKVKQKTMDSKEKN